MAINSLTLRPAVLKAKDVATIADIEANAAILRQYADEAINMSGYVLPEDVADAINNNTTTIEGSKITTGSISASKINTQGLIAENISADTIIGKNIAGGSISGVNIEGVNITGAVIKASWIDYTSVGALTDWAVYTTSTIPSQYAANFAHNNDGTLTVSGGYVKLPTVSGVMSVPATASAGACGDHGGSAWSAGGVQNQLHSNASYTSSSTRRFVRAQPMFNALSVTTPIIQLTH
jgi:hypothetical protein